MKYFYAFLILCILWLEVDSIQRIFRRSQSTLRFHQAHHLLCTSVDYDDLLEEIVFSGDVAGYVQKATSKDVVLTEQFFQYVSDAAKKSNDNDEKQLLGLIASLISSRQGIDKGDDKEVADFRINNNLPMNVAEGFQSASGVFQPVNQLTAEVEDDLDWRERMKIMQRGEERDVSGKVVDRLGVFDKKKETTVINNEVIAIDPLEAAKKAQAAADIMKKKEEEMLAIQRANIEREAANQKVWKGF